MKQYAWIGLRIEPELKEAAMAKAEAEDLSLSQVIRRLLRQWLAEDPPDWIQQPQQEGVYEGT